MDVHELDTRRHGPCVRTWDADASSMAYSVAFLVMIMVRKWEDAAKIFQHAEANVETKSSVWQMKR